LYWHLKSKGHQIDVAYANWFVIGDCIGISNPKAMRLTWRMPIGSLWEIVLAFRIQRPWDWCGICQLVCYRRLYWHLESKGHQIDVAYANWSVIGDCIGISNPKAMRLTWRMPIGLLSEIVLASRIQRPSDWHGVCQLVCYRRLYVLEFWIQRPWDWRGVCQLVCYWRLYWHLESKGHEIDVAYANWSVVGHSPCFFWHLNPKTLDMMWRIFLSSGFCWGAK
jgi:multidrug transporter EmrE-like cation transporter